MEQKDSVLTEMGTLLIDSINAFRDSGDLTYQDILITLEQIKISYLSEMMLVYTENQKDEDDEDEY